MYCARAVQYTSLRCAHENSKVTIKQHAVRAHEGTGVYRHAFETSELDGSWR